MQRNRLRRQRTRSITPEAAGLRASSRAVWVTSCSGIVNMREHEVTQTARLLARSPAASGVMERVLWRLNRLRCMTHAEIRHRALRAVEIQAERWGLLGSATVPPPDLTQESRRWILATAKVDAAPYLAAAERIAAGRF